MLQWVLWILVALVVIKVGMIIWQNTRVPTLGQESGQLQPLGSKPNGVSTQTDDRAKRVEPWPFGADLASTQAAVRTAVQAYGGGEFVTEDGPYLRVLFTTPRLRFHDDAEFYLDEASQQVHFRSESRSGYSDMGLNRKRFEALSEHYRAALASPEN